jgi:diguanylate cyclase (GGDEF)-like protein
MKEQSRPTDVAARYGGDEFRVVLIDSDQDMAQNVAKRIEARGTTRKSRVLAWALAWRRIRAKDEQELLEAADQQLYGQKRKAQSKNVTVE